MMKIIYLIYQAAEHRCAENKLAGQINLRGYNGKFREHQISYSQERNFIEGSLCHAAKATEGQVSCNRNAAQSSEQGFLCDPYGEDCTSVQHCMKMGEFCKNYSGTLHVFT